MDGKACNAARIESRLDRQDAARARKRAARALAKARKSQERASQVQRYVQAHRNLLAASDPNNGGARLPE